MFNVLFLCTGNSARSIIAESLLNHWGKGRFRAFSAGSRPKGDVHPLTLATLRRYHLPVDGLRSKSWDEFAVSNAPMLHFVFAVCDNAAKEVCPVWPGQPMTAHWAVEDPAAVVGSTTFANGRSARHFENSMRGLSCSQACASNCSTGYRCNVSLTGLVDPNARRCRCHEVE
jgi:arsenate reductase